MRVNIQEDDNVEIQMAPLIDCVFLLLIFFLVATTLKDINKELPVELPYAGAAIEVREQPNTLVIGLDKYGGLFINATPTTVKMLLSQVEKAKKTGMFVRLDADKDTRYEKVLEVIEMCYIKGVSNVKLHTRKEKKLTPQ